MLGNSSLFALLQKDCHMDLVIVGNQLILTMTTSVLIYL